MKTSDDKFKVTYKGKEIELPVYTGTQGPDVVDIAKALQGNRTVHL